MGGVHSGGGVNSEGVQTCRADRCECGRGGVSCTAASQRLT